MLKIYRMELRRSPILIAMPALIALDIAVLFGRSRHWIGVWPEASAAAQVVTLFLGPALAAVSAWQAGRASRSGMPEFLQAAACPVWAIEAVRLAATLTLGYIAYGIGCLVAAALSLPDAGPGFLWPSYVLLGVSTLTAYAAVGHIVGRAWPSAAFTPVVCALGGFVAFMTVGQIYGQFVLSGAPGMQLQPLPVTLRLLFALSLVGLAVLLPRPSRSMKGVRRTLPARTRLAVTSFAALAFVLAASIPVAGEVRVQRQASSVTPLCRSASDVSPRVCVWPEHRKYLPELTNMARRLSEIPDSWIRTPDTFYEYGLRPTDLGDPGFEIMEGHVRSAAIAMGMQTKDESLGVCIPPRDAPRARQAVNNISMWFEYRAMGQDLETADAGLTISGAPGSQRAAGEASVMSESDQRSWTSTERAHLKKWCRSR
ncbi:ABC transporter permease [Streptomyces sp. NPDC057545]|uniref:ABC transporter permease n=1 Tax=Streptomyces sp. NPDC057545 TaxID=3346164 RepID=UPI00367589C1